MSESEPLQVRVFVCHNALADPLEKEPLRELGVATEQVPCLGRIDPRYLLKAFEGGCDAVCLIGCPIGKCRTMDGNLRAQKRVAFLRGLLDEIGVDGERLFLFLREPMGDKGLREVVGEFLAGVRSSGPTELKTGREIEIT
ncbi:hydrogenase iron-sulfur subunit [bacterium]|nr:hydrogenase iron-sulfur subunit [bacterium]